MGIPALTGAALYCRSLLGISGGEKAPFPFYMPLVFEKDIVIDFMTVHRREQPIHRNHIGLLIGQRRFITDKPLFLFVRSKFIAARINVWTL